MKVKELAQGLNAMIAEGHAELEVIVEKADGTVLPIVRVVVDNGVEVIEPNQVPAVVQPKLVTG